MADLSIIIPARNEIFLAKTVENLLENIEGDTEIIIILDGQWADPGVDDDKRVSIIYLPEPIGQRAATNLGVKMSRAKYVMKLDAHCAVSKGFDRSMVEAFNEVGGDVTMVPKMYNLYAFDWVCPDGHRRYQSPSDPCKECGKPTHRELKWEPRPSPETTAMCFDRDLKFQYQSGYKKHQEGDLVETMSLLGACWMLTRERYWKLNICDEGHGSWGQQGTEVACKTWLTGGRLICNKRCWFAHMFRTQGRDFGFPYPNAGINASREYSRRLWLNHKWPQAEKPIWWLIKKFKPTQWEAPSRGIIYYTDNRLNVKLAKQVQGNLKVISENFNIPITSVSLKPMPHFGNNIHLPLERGVITMFKQILTALENSKEEIVYFCEHDVLYHPSHFDIIPPHKDMFYYNHNWWKVWPDGFAAHWDANQVAMLVCYREHAINFYRKRIEQISREGFNRSYEPGGRDRKLYEPVWSEVPNVDVRHDNNQTRSHRSPNDFRDKSGCVNWQESTIDKIPGWPNLNPY